MISKVITGKTFYGTCRYICKDEKRAQVLETEGVRGYNYKLKAADFEMQQSYRPSLKNAVFHGILSFYPGEKITDEKMVEIAKEYLHEMSIINTQYSITKHIDKNHPHLHIIANLVNNKGETIKDNWIGLKGKKVAQRLTLKFSLKHALSKNLSMTNLERLNEKEANRYVIYQAISEQLPLSKNLEESRQRLEKQGIETLYKNKGQTQELQGISFKIGEYYRAGCYSNVFIMGWINSYQSKKNFEANDIKYRALKIRGNKTLLEFLHQTDSLYNLDEENLRKHVITQEQRLINQAEMLRLAGEKEREVKELKDKIKKNKKIEKK